MYLATCNPHHESLITNPRYSQNISIYYIKSLSGKIDLNPYIRERYKFEILLKIEFGEGIVAPVPLSSPCPVVRPSP